MIGLGWESVEYTGHRVRVVPRAWLGFRGLDNVKGDKLQQKWHKG